MVEWFHTTSALQWDLGEGLEEANRKEKSVENLKNLKIILNFFDWKWFEKHCELQQNLEIPLKTEK